jgi:hypothetical protein
MGPGSACKKDPSLALVQACPGSEQEGPVCVAQCPHERRSGARGISDNMKTAVEAMFIGKDRQFNVPIR